MLSKEYIIVTQNFLHCMSEITLGVQNMHTKIAYVNENYVKSDIYKLKKKLYQNTNIHINIYYKNIENKSKYLNHNMSILPLNDIYF